MCSCRTWPRARPPGWAWAPRPSPSASPPSSRARSPVTAPGPWADRKAYDLLVQCQTGLVSLTGNKHGSARTGVSIADIAAGMYAYSGVLTALFTRATTGVARAVEVSLFEALAEWMGQPAYYTRHGGTQPPRLGTQHATIAPYGAYPAADGKDVLFSIQNEREWAALCERFLGRHDLVH